jgi:hypothetical protein
MDLDYIDVAARLVEFRGKHPEGSLQPADLTQPFRVETIGDQTYIVVVAAAYRSADDPRPGVGMAYEVFPGRTPYTKGSELQNAETSAWGRAIVAALAADTKRGVASAQEVRNRRAEQEVPEQRQPEQDPASAVRGQISRWATSNGYTLQDAADRFQADHDGRHIGSEADPNVLNAFFASWQKEHQTRTGEAQGATA